MSTLYLHCELCGRRQADGLLSRAAWGHVQLPSGETKQACRTCTSSTADWQDRLRALAGAAGSSLEPGSLGLAQGSATG
jgi:hypothetical protein